MKFKVEKWLADAEEEEKGKGRLIGTKIQLHGTNKFQCSFKKFLNFILIYQTII
jgi:hypothetical protein